MKKVDYIIVGCGLAGIAFCEQLIQHDISFVVFDDQSQLSSIVAAGLYNPIVLKRFNEVWKANEQLGLALPFYNHLEEKLKVTLDEKIPILRRFASIAEQNEWFSACDKPNFENYLSTQLIKNENPAVVSPYGFGKVLQTGRIDTAVLLQHYKVYLKGDNLYKLETFKYDSLKIQNNSFRYGRFSAKNIVFAEGFGMMKNPFFNTLPLNEAKGEVITIKAPNLKIDYILKSSVFVVPLGNDLYSVGATYNWDDKTNDITEVAKIELLSKLKQLITCDFEVIDQKAGIRPTVNDRRPLVGTHPIHQKMAILNGLGTRGVMIAPYAAKNLYNWIEHGIPLDPEMDISRFNVL
jgi:hypothetical protein